MLTPTFRTLARVRGARVFHPRGIVLRGMWRPAEGETPLPPGSPLSVGARPVLLRISRGVGLPTLAPDILGLAIKLVDVHGPGRDQDLLLASSGQGRVTQHLLRVGRDVADVTFSSVLPYEIAGRRRGPVVAQARTRSRRATYPMIVREGARRVPVFEVRLDSAEGPLLATVEATERHPGGAEPDPVFDPWNTGPELSPTGWVNRLRRPTYAASREGRGREPTSPG